MGWLITLGILVLLGILPLGASVKYDADGPLVKVIAGPIRITVYPRDKITEFSEWLSDSSYSLFRWSALSA